MTPEELLAIATEFRIGKEPIINGKLVPDDVKNHNVCVVNTGHPDDGPDRWGIFFDEIFCLSKNGEKVYARNSQKDEEFYKRCRFDERDVAIEYAQRWIAEVRRQAKPIFETQGYVNYEDLILDFDTLMKGE